VKRSGLTAWLATVRTPVAICLAQRAALFLVVFLGMVMDRLVVEGTFRPLHNNFLLDGWLRWDSEHYYNIARQGYQLLPNTLQQPTNFWPLYPLLLHTVQGYLGGPLFAGLIVSNLALLCSCVMLHRWVCRRFGKEVATRTITLLLCFPFAFYFSAMYTESIFLLGAVGAFYFSQRNRWLLASCCAAMAGGSRLVGVIVFVAVVLSYAERHRWRPATFGWDALWLPVGLAGTLGYIWFLQYRFDDGFAFLRTQWVPGWGDNSSWSRLTVVAAGAFRWRRLVLGTIDAIALVNLAFGCLALLGCLVVFRRVGLAAGTWGIVTMLISLRIWASAGRYAAVAWPMFLAGALLTERRPNLYLGIVGAMSLLQSLLAVWFAHGHWVA
jgi:hypothetical protein